MKTTPEDVEALYAVTRNARENCVVADAAAAITKIRLILAYALELNDQELLALLNAPRVHSAEAPDREV